MRKYYKNGKLVGGQTKIASAAKPFDKITGEDFKALKRKKAMGGGMMRKTFKKGGGADASKFHTKKDGTKARKGLYYYMNRAKKRGTSKPGKGSVTDKALKQSAKTAKA